jgi:hypothetical protein
LKLDRSRIQNKLKSSSSSKEKIETQKLIRKIGVFSLKSNPTLSCQFQMSFWLKVYHFLVNAKKTETSSSNNNNGSFKTIATWEEITSSRLTLSGNLSFFLFCILSSFTKSGTFFSLTSN